MTLAQIYARVVFNLFGNSAVPAGTAVVLRGTEGADTFGLIQNAHREIQKDYNYWFMRMSTSYPHLNGDHALPENFKENIAVMTRDYVMKENSPLLALSADDYYNLRNTDVNSENETEAVYPTAYELNDDNLALYNSSPVDPLIDWDLIVSKYGEGVTGTVVDDTSYSYLDGTQTDPTVTDTVMWHNGTTYEIGIVLSVVSAVGTTTVTIDTAFTWTVAEDETIGILNGTETPHFVYLNYYGLLDRLDLDADFDDLTVNGAELIIYKTCADFSIIREEDKQAMMYSARAKEREDYLRHLDYQRRQRGYARVTYQE